MLGLVLTKLSFLFFLCTLSDAAGTTTTQNNIEMSNNNTNPSVTQLMGKGPEYVASYLSGIYEHSPWVSEELSKCDLTQYTKVTQLADAMKAIVESATYEEKLTLLKAHPDLCEKVGKLEALTADSQEEQSRSGLQSLTETELALFNEMNDAYRTKCGFPFILAVRNASKQTVLAALEGRLNHNSVETEFTIAMQQVHKIAWMRLLAKINTDDAQGFLTCHVLDTANGIPGMFFFVPLFLSWRSLDVIFF
jgi:2-oxo-4-hydroxy-4-carboxy-5-ureidoimidazoline decarboxylase